MQRSSEERVTNKTALIRWTVSKLEMDVISYLISLCGFGINQKLKEHREKENVLLPKLTESMCQIDEQNKEEIKSAITVLDYCV